MDIVSHVLHEAGLVRRLLNLRALTTHRALRFPCDRSMGLHIVTQGPLWIHVPGQHAPIALGTGDIALMARGHVHVLASDASLHGLTVESVTDRAGIVPFGSGATGDTSLAGSQVISGAYQLWSTPLHPMFAQLPSWFVLRASDVPPLSPLALAVGLLRAEVDTPQIGSKGVLDGLLDVVFAYLLRALMQRQASTVGVAMVLQDGPVHQAVSLLHEDCAYAWSLDTLAARVGLSRTGLAERFRAAMGDTPLHYLRTVRMQHAMRLLSDTTHSLEQVARAVGYQDAFSFSKVFKKSVGVSPRDFRRQDTMERSAPFRFSAGG
jgi:AraC-like DNA-binding protein